MSDLCELQFQYECVIMQQKKYKETPRVVPVLHTNKHKLYKLMNANILRSQKRTLKWQNVQLGR